MGEVETEVKKEFKLPNKKVTIRLVDAPRGMHRDKNHAAYNLLEGSTIELCVPNKKGQRVVDCPLNAEEIEFFENKRKSGMAFSEGDLSPHREDKDNYWRSRKSKVTLDSNRIELDLSDPADYIKYKILLKNKNRIAPSLAEEFGKKSYIFVMESDDDVQKNVVIKGDIKKRAWKLAAKMEDDREAMLDFLNVAGKRPSGNSKLAFLVAEVDKYVEEHMPSFLEILEDKYYETRILLTKAVQCKAVLKEGKKYFAADGSELCNRGDVNNMQSALAFLEAIENQDIRMVIEAKLINK